MLNWITLFPFENRINSKNSSLKVYVKEIRFHQFKDFFETILYFKRHYLIIFS